MSDYQITGVIAIDPPPITGVIAIDPPPITGVIRGFVAYDPGDAALDFSVAANSMYLAWF